MTVKKMKKRMTAGMQDDMPAPAPVEQALSRLGAAFIERLRLPEGMSVTEAAETIIAMWNDADASPQSELRESGEQRGMSETRRRDSDSQEDALEDGTDAEEYGGEADAFDPRMLPRTLRGGVSEPPAADYESMSAEQFRRLKKQLKRASLDGRRIRL